jgi:hypothetical protein
MMFVFLLGVLTFVIVAIAANSGGTSDVHVQDVYGPIAFLSSVVVATLGFLLKWLITRDRNQIDYKIAVLESTIEKTRSALETDTDKKRQELRESINGLGIKVEHLADVVDEKVSEAVEELRRHDRELFLKWDGLNREFGQLRGEHDAMKRQHDRSARPYCPPE